MNKLEDFQPLRPAEEKLRAAAQAGETASAAEIRSVRIIMKVFLNLTWLNRP